MTTVPQSTARRPRIALAMGDPAGISPELTAKLLASSEACAAADLLVIGDKRVLDAGAKAAGLAPDVLVIDGPDHPFGGRPLFWDRGHLDSATIAPGVASQAGGAFALANYTAALDLARAGKVDAVCFTPFNKAAMKLAEPGYGDDVVFTTGYLRTSEPASEFNILGPLWNARVTSHVPISGVASRITHASVLKGIRLTDATLRASGVARPRIAVAALNPHAGDGGNFGREEIDEIAPAVEVAKGQGIAVDGPFPSDTVFLRAKSGAFDAVLTMYHDQGQIAMKLMGFERGVTYLAGYGFPICTPAHGTAYEIAGKGVADPGATIQAVLIAARLAAHQPGASA
jgi:4-hydroxythreonine-4-phosphate dehydrogenase